MRLKEKFERKHIHTWILTQKRDKDSVWTPAERKCSDCGKVMSARIHDTEIVPDSVLAYADAMWYDGGLPK